MKKMKVENADKNPCKDIKLINSMAEILSKHPKTRTLISRMPQIPINGSISGIEPLFSKEYERRYPYLPQTIPFSYTKS